jgi:hypothetical protein
LELSFIHAGLRAAAEVSLKVAESAALPCGTLSVFSGIRWHRFGMTGAPRPLRLLVAVLAVLMVGACGTNAITTELSGGSSGIAAATSPENNPVGDIPDTQVYVPFAAPDGSFTVSVPEGWAQTTDGSAVTFTDKLNAVRIDARHAASPPTPDSVRQDVLSSVQTSDGRFTIEVVKRRSGDAVVATYMTASPSNPVTGKAGTDDVARYSFWRQGSEVILTLSGPVGADNVDPWQTITDSFQWR